MGRTLKDFTPWICNCDGGLGWSISGEYHLCAHCGFSPFVGYEIDPKRETLVEYNKRLGRPIRMFIPPENRYYGVDK